MMKNWTNRIAIATFLFMTAIPVLGDVPDPRRQKPSTDSNGMTAMRIALDRKGGQATLEIPRDVVAQLRADLDGAESQTVGAVAATPFNGNNARTVMAGLFLSLAFGFGGLWFVRSRGKADGLTRVALGVAVAALCGASAGIAYANAGPPPLARSFTSRILVPEAKSWGVFGRVKVRIVNDNREIRLILPESKDEAPK